MKIKDDIIEKWEDGWTVYEIAEHYCTPVENIINILGLGNELHWWTNAVYSRVLPNASYYATVETLAENLGKSTKSIIGKLSREGVYERAVYKNKSGDLPVTKAEIVSNIAENLGLEIENLLGLEKAPKATLKALELATGATQLHEYQDIW